MDNIKGLFERNKIKPSTPRAQRQRSQISATDVCQKKKCRTQAFTRLNLRLGDGKWLEKGGYVCVFVIMCDWFEGFAAAFLRRKIRSQVRASPSRFLAAPCSAQRRASANKVQRATSGSSDGACRRSCLNIFLGHGASGICFFPFCSCRFYLEH